MEEVSLFLGASGEGFFLPPFKVTDSFSPFFFRWIGAVDFCLRKVDKSTSFLRQEERSGSTVPCIP